VTEEPPPPLPDPIEPMTGDDSPPSPPADLPDPSEPEYRGGFPRIRDDDPARER
jgi:hypothetical protein